MSKSWGEVEEYFADFKRRKEKWEERQRELEATWQMRYLHDVLGWIVAQVEERKVKENAGQ